MANDFANSYAEIIKSERQEDGSLLVYGKATDDGLDIDNQICDDEWLGRAMPEWFKTGGNIREQHSNIAAGVAKEYEAKADGHYIRALVVDPNSVKKVESGVLKGFSIGIKSPRIVRDSKAANGRIVDGSIVEISLVDRPANPSCQLVLAKSVAGESTLVQVEDLIENTNKSIITTSVGEEPKLETNTIVKTILEMHDKAVNGDKVKFDQASYDVARAALARLIMVEAGEMISDNTDERDSIDHILDALKHLFRWYEGEVEEGEVMDANNADLLQMSATAKDACECECDSCKEDKGCESKMCKCAMAKSADVAKCLECGCNQVGTNHGASTVQIPGNGFGTSTTANTSTVEMKSAEGEEAVVEETPAEEIKVEETPAEKIVAEEATPEILDEKTVSSIVEKAIKSATESVKNEIALLKSATKAAEDKAMALESELVVAKSAAANGGPKRTGSTSVNQNNELLLKAAEYRNKAVATSDPILAKGYRSLANEYLTKAGVVTSDEE